MDNEDKIKEILASQDKQSQIDAIRITENSNISIQNVEGIRKELVRRRINKFPLQDDEQRKQKRRYTQSFKEALKEEIKGKKEKIIEEQKRKIRVKQVMRAYNDQKIFMPNMVEQEGERKSNLIQIVLERMLERLKQEERKSKESDEKGLLSEKQKHQQFMESIQPKMVQEMKRVISTEKNNIEYDKKDER